MSGKQRAFLLAPAKVVVEAAAAGVTGQRVPVSLGEPRVVSVADEVLEARGQPLHPPRPFLGLVMAASFLRGQPAQGGGGGGGTGEARG